MKKIGVFLFLIMIMGLGGFFYVFHHAYAEEADEPSVSIGDLTLAQGVTGTVSVDFNYIENLSGLSFEIHYDSSLFLLSSWQIDPNLAQENIVVNSQTNCINVSLLSLDGLTYSGGVLMLNFSLAETVPLGDYLLDLAVLEAYDSSLNPLVIQAQDGLIKVVGIDEVPREVYFSSAMSDQELNYGDLVTYSLSSSNLDDFAAGDFEIYYESDLLEVVAVTLSSGMAHEDALYSINDATEGFIDIAYVSLIELFSVTDLIEVQFRVLADLNADSFVLMIPKDLYSLDLKPLIADQNSITFHTFLTEVEPDKLDVYVSNYHGPTTDAFSLNVGIEAGSSLGAGDFVVSYDQSLLEILGVTEGPNIATNGGYLIYNPNYSTGDLAFSYINSAGLMAAETFLTITFLPLQTNVETNLEITIAGTGLVDHDFNQLDLDFISSTVFLDLALNKSEITLEETMFDIDVSATSITLELENYTEDIFYSLDGIPYSQGNVIEGLTENTLYNVHVYLRDTTSHYASNIITMSIMTPLTLETFTVLAEAIPEGLASRDAIIDLIGLKSRLGPLDQTAAEDLINGLISEYNALIQAINQEYIAAIEISQAVKPDRSPVVDLHQDFIFLDGRRCLN